MFVVRTQLKVFKEGSKSIDFNENHPILFYKHTSITIVVTFYARLLTKLFEGMLGKEYFLTSFRIVFY